MNYLNQAIDLDSMFKNRKNDRYKLGNDQNNK